MNRSQSLTRYEIQIVQILNSRRWSKFERSASRRSITRVAPIVHPPSEKWLPRFNDRRLHLRVKRESMIEAGRKVRRRLRERFKVSLGETEDWSCSPGFSCMCFFPFARGTMEHAGIYDPTCLVTQFRESFCFYSKVDRFSLVPLSGRLVFPFATNDNRVCTRTRIARWRWLSLTLLSSDSFSSLFTVNEPSSFMEV